MKESSPRNQVPRIALCAEAAAKTSSLRLRLWALAVVLGILFGVSSARAGTAVVTFTNFPAVVSNTYNGVITLQINGLTNGVTNVVVQKFLDLNTNGIIDSGDLLVQQFPLTVGQAGIFTNGPTLVTVTNFLPGDMTLNTTGQITAPLNFQDGDFMQTLAGQYIYRISSPSGQFSPSTQLFTVTNSFFSSLITGAVENASSPNSSLVSNAIVLLCVVQNGSFSVQGGAVANNSGYFAIRAPASLSGQQYFLAAAKSNFVADISSEPAFSLIAQETVALTNYLAPATTNITGRVVDAVNRSMGLAGLAGMAVSSNNFMSLYVSDTNGNFSAPVVNDTWVAPVNGFAAAFAGYLTWQTNQALNVSNTLVTVTNALAKATAIFYGTVSNNSAVPLPGVYLSAIDSAGHESTAMTDQHGHYVIGVIAGTNEWQLSVQAANNPGLVGTNVFNPGYILTNSIGNGQAIPQNFVVAQAPYSIQGAVYDINNNPISGVEVVATSTNGYQAVPVTTASDGAYTLQVSPGTWTVEVDSNSLAGLGYTNFPASDSVTISGASVSGINFHIVVCGEVQILTTNLPAAMVGSPYNTALLAESCGNITNWSPAYGITLTSLYDQTNITYPPGTAIYSESKLVGYVESYFYFGLEVIGGQLTPVATNITYSTASGSGLTENFYNLTATVNVTAPFTNVIGFQFSSDGSGKTWTAQPTTQNGSTYSTVISMSKYTMNYSSGGKPQLYTVTNGAVMIGSGSPSNTVATLGGVFHSMPAFGNSVNLPSPMPYTGSNNAVVWIQGGTNVPGQYFISAYGPQTTNLPPGLNLYPDGTISGTPTSAGTNGGAFNFTVAAQDDASAASVQTLSLYVYPATTLGAAPAQAGSVTSSNLFQMQVNGVLAGQNYTLLMNTNLASTNWVPIFTTNAPNTNSLLIPDSNATNPERFYRIELGP